jgi:hypothetical protein
MEVGSREQRRIAHTDRFNIALLTPQSGSHHVPRVCARAIFWPARRLNAHYIQNDLLGKG